MVPLAAWIYIFFMGVGLTATSRNNLNDHHGRLTGSLNNVDKYGSYKQTDDNGIEAATNSCGGKKADIFFALDTSSSVSEKEIRHQLDLISTVSNILTFEDDQTRAAVVSYGSETVMDMRLGAYKNTSAFKSGLLPSPGLGGKRDIGQMMEFVDSKGFRSSLARPSVAHILVILTTGPTRKFRFASEKAENLKKSGRYVYVLYTGSDVIDDKYYRLASFPAKNFVFHNDPYGVQTSLSSLLAMNPCDLAIDQPVYLPKTPWCRIKRPVDMVFAVDHLSSGKVHTRLIYQFVRQFLADMWDPENKVMVGIAAPRNPSIRAAYRKLMVSTKLTSELADIRFPSYTEMLRKTRKLLTRGRPTVNKLAVMFVDESVLVDKSVLAEAHKNKDRKIETYVVSFGEYVDELSLGMMASDKDSGYLIRLTDYNKLSELHEDIAAMICRGL